MHPRVIGALTTAVLVSTLFTPPASGFGVGSPQGAAAAVACIGNGTAGNRVQLMYVRQEGQPSRLAEVTPQMRSWAEQIDKMFLQAARDTGGFRRVRWVTGQDCLPTVVEHVVPDGLTDFGQLLVQLGEDGLRPVNRKLLIAHDVQGYCGFGEVEPDDTAGPTNRNNTQTQALGGAVAESCWGFPAAAHELVHTLGAVQDSAPHASGERHCIDWNDLMCDGSQPGSPADPVCPAVHRNRLDCHYDDYFNVDPEPGSYLDTHWNIADSSFLSTAEWFLPPDRPESPVAKAGTASVRLTWEPPLFDGASPVTGYVVTVNPSGQTIQTGTSTSLLVTGLRDGDPVSFSVQATTEIDTGPSSITTNLVTPTPKISAVMSFRHQAPVALAAGPRGTSWVGTKAGLVRVSARGHQELLSGPGQLGRPLEENTRLRRTPMRPLAIATQPGSGDLYVVDALSDRVRRIRDGKVTSVTRRRIQPTAIAFDARGRLLVTEAGAHRVWRRGAGDTFTRIAGSAGGEAGFSGDGGPATSALLRRPTGIAADNNGNVYIADFGNHRVRRIGPSGKITTFAGNGADIVIPGAVFDGTDAIFLLLPRPTGITFGNGRLFVQSGGRVVAIRPDRIHVTYVGSPGELGNAGDGKPARQAHISDDVQLAAMPGGKLLILDRTADRLRAVAQPSP